MKKRILALLLAMLMVFSLLPVTALAAEAEEPDETIVGSEENPSEVSENNPEPGEEPGNNPEPGEEPGNNPEPGEEPGNNPDPGEDPEITIEPSETPETEETELTEEDTLVGVAASVIASGTCGASLTWSLTDDGTLTISGTGKMTDFDRGNTSAESPWSQYSSRITKAVISSGVTSVGSFAFQGANKMTSVTLPSGLTSIGDEAFYACWKLSSISIPSTVTSIGEQAFGMNKFTTITIPKNVTSIGIGVFANCWDLETIQVDSGNSKYCSMNGALLDKNKTTLLQIPGAFSSNYTLPKTVKTILPYACCGCTEMTGITLPSGLISIGESAFNECSSLTSVTLPSGLKSIGRAAFRYCSELTSVTFPPSLTSLGECAFEQCSGLKTVMFSSGLTRIESETFDGCTSLESVKIPDSVTSIGEFAFSGCNNLAKLTIPSGVTTIEHRAFGDCTSLTRVTIPKSVTSIGKEAFTFCNRLTQINFLHDAGDPLTLGEYAFDNYNEDDIYYDTLVCVPDPENVHPALQDYDWEYDYRYVTFDLYTGEPDEPDVPATDIPIVVIPGIMGSKLFNINGEQVWPVTIAYDLLGIQYSMTVPGEENNGLFLETDSDKEYGTLDSYKALVKYLRDKFPDRDVYFFSYDWRQSNIVSARRLANAIADYDQVDFVCHSMGGLVLSQFVSAGGADKIHRAVILGTPYEGATKLLQAMLTKKVMDSPADYLFQLCKLSYEVKRELPGLGELAPTEDYQKGSNEKILCYMEKTATKSIDIDIPGWVDSLNEMHIWLKIPSMDTTVNFWKKEIRSWLEDLEANYTVRGLYVLNLSWRKEIQVFYLGGERDYSRILAACIPGTYSSVTYAQGTAKDGYTRLLEMPNVFFGIGDSKNTLCGATLVYPMQGNVCIEDVVEGIGDGTVPFASASILGNISNRASRVRYYGVKHGQLAGDKTPADSWVKIQNWISYALGASNSTANTGRTSASGAAKNSYTYVRIACPVEAEITYGGETLSSDPDHFCDETSFGRLYLLGENEDIKVFILDSDVAYDVTAQGSDNGTMDYEVRYCSGSDEVLEAREAFEIPITPETVITTNTDQGSTTLLYVDENGDGTAEDIIVADPVAGLTEPLKLEQEYIILKEGDTASLNLTVEPAELAGKVVWAAVDTDNVLLGENPVITVDEHTGEIRAKRAGTAYVEAYVACGNRVYTALCRVDVVAGEGEHPIADDVTEEVNGVSGVRLTNTKATSELFRTEYTRIQVIPELTENNVTAQSVVLPTPTPASDAGIAIEDACFAEDSVAALFALRVVDDRTLEIIPTQAALDGYASVKGPYSSPVVVTVDGTEFTTDSLTLTIKKTEPKLTAKAVTLNSYYSDTQTVVFNGGTVKSAIPDSSKAMPDWLQYDPNTNSFTFTGVQNAKKSAKVTLLAELEGWCVQRPVTVSISAKSTAPKLSFKPSTLTLKPGTMDSAVAAWTVTPAAFAGEPVSVSRITEGKSEYVNGEVLNVTLGDGVATVSAPHVDGKAHTYKVWLSVAGKETAFTVKTLADTKAVSLTLKAKGTIDLAIPKSPVTITAATKNYNTAEATFTVSAICKAKTTEDISGLFQTAWSGNVLTVTANGDTEPGSYTATVEAYFGADTPAKASVNFTVKRSTRIPAASVSLKAAGSIDVLRPETAVTLTPTVKNCYTYELTDDDVRITKTYDGASKTKVSEDVTESFAITVEKEKYVVRAITSAGVSHADKFSVQATVSGIPSKVAALKVVQGKVKVSQSAKAVTLLKTDRYSRADIGLSLPDTTLAGIRSVNLDEKSATLFSLTELENGKYAIGYAGNKITTTKAQTIKLQVFLEGNQTTLPNATISLKINFA